MRATFLRSPRGKFVAFISLMLFALFSPPSLQAVGKGRAKQRPASDEANRSGAQVSIDGPTGPIRRPLNASAIKCNAKTLETARSRYQATMAKGETDRARNDLSRSVRTNCSQLPSKYVPTELNQAFFWIVHDLAAASLKLGQKKKCLDVLSPYLRADSPVSYTALGFDGQEAFIVAMEKVEAECLGGATKSVGQAGADTPSERRPGSVFRSDDEDVPQNASSELEGE